MKKNDSGIDRYLKNEIAEMKQCKRQTGVGSCLIKKAIETGVRKIAITVLFTTCN